MVTAAELTQILKERVPAEEVIANDDSNSCGMKFSVVVVSTVFADMKLLQRQRHVNECIKEELKEIHALSMRTWTPEQWETKKESYVM